MSNELPVADRRLDPAEMESRFQGLVQSPLRAAILRFLCARPDDAFEMKRLIEQFQSTYYRQQPPTPAPPVP
jgi:hypothetical protein